MFYYVYMCVYIIAYVRIYTYYYKCECIDVCMRADMRACGIIGGKSAPCVRES